MSRNRLGVPISRIAAASEAGAGTSGAFWIRTIGLGKAVGVRFGSGVARDSVETSWIFGGSSGQGASSERQKRVSSFDSQELQAPMTASAKTPARSGSAWPRSG